MTNHRETKQNKETKTPNKNIAQLHNFFVMLNQHLEIGELVLSCLNDRFKSKNQQKEKKRKKKKIHIVTLHVFTNS